MTGIDLVQNERSKFSGHMRRSEPNLGLVAFGYKNVFPIRRELDVVHRRFKVEVMQDGRTLEVNQHSSTIRVDGQENVGIRR